MIGLMLLYLLVILVLVRVLGGKRSYTRPLSLWLEQSVPKARARRT
jgi:hypothetical protein